MKYLGIIFINVFASVFWLQKVEANKLDEANYSVINHRIVNNANRIVGLKQNRKVSNKTDLVQALNEATSGQVIYVDDNASINLSGVKNLVIPKGVTLASGRGKNKSKGALIFTNTNGTLPLFAVGGPGVRITGLRIQGSDTGIYAKGRDAFEGKSENEKKVDRLKLYKQNMYGVPVSRGIVVNQPNVKIDNCEIYGWTHAAILVQKGGVNTQIIGNYIHHNRRFGLGYGVALDEGSAIIKNNKFDFNSHSITGTGRPGTSFEACYNTFGENHERAWAVDMHGGEDRKDGSERAGDKIVVYNNTFNIKANAKGIKGIVIRGIPSQEAEIYNNTFYRIGGKNNNKISSQKKSFINKSMSTNKNPLDVSEDMMKSVFSQTNAKGNIRLYNNKIIEK